MDEYQREDLTPKKRKNPIASFFELFRYTLIALAIVFVVRTYIAQPFIVDGSSMYPTFEDKQYLIVDEISYRFEDPQRGDVIIFRYPKNPSAFYIKRVIGLPGETVTIISGKVMIKNSEYPDGFYIEEPYINEMDLNDNLTRILEEDEYFVMGDNRNFSSDSRHWGNVPRENIVGTPLFRLFPVDSISIKPGDYEVLTLEN
ncbi:signal peptidase I [Candidatus Nomurabacteria bacterium]|nr:signal peptidase I [Candidatus Nomurabacteria bacterium]USN95086.1 MAG: signal peptidase I [Candidatus Nomurabacteria bacterium]